jgi:heme a synthase
MLPPFVRRFRTMGAVTLWAVYVLILVGGIVRGTGAGMGCPDWPKCFGRWVPPTSAAELPADYKETYRAGRIAKNQQVAARLDKMGFHEVAQNIFRNPASFIETDFNVTKTWIEYVNRLVGAVIGLLITLTFVSSWSYWRHDKTVTIVAGLALITVGVQGWLGSLVVSTNLVPAMVTWHMALALLLLALLHYAHLRTTATTINASTTSTPLLIGSMWAFVALVFGQILLGTQVREGIDVVAAKLNYINRDLWIERLGHEFSYHRALSTLLLLTGMWISYRAWMTGDKVLQKRVVWLMGLLVLNPLLGFGLSQWAMPAWIQPLHLTVGTGLFGAAVVVALTVSRQGDQVKGKMSEEGGELLEAPVEVLSVPTRG